MKNTTVKLIRHVKAMFLTNAVFCSLLLAPHANAQEAVKVTTGGFKSTRRFDETTPIFEEGTGKRLSKEEFRTLARTNFNGYRLIPDFNEYGEIGFYTIRPMTEEEQQNRRFNDRDPARRPNEGTRMPELVFNAIDKKEYRLTEQQGKVVLLSFWLSTQKPFWSPVNNQKFTEAVGPFLANTDFLSLGILLDGKDEISKAMETETFSFIPVPDGTGFHQKMHLTTFPAFAVIDKNGTIVAWHYGSKFDELKKILQRVVK
ncbi:TlpA family protein disulfide reductase [Arsenicibacter rosenii]|nr:redoxin family protein [Arsenicibacter rosenii]